MHTPHVCKYGLEETIPFMCAYMQIQGVPCAKSMSERPITLFSVVNRKKEQKVKDYNFYF